MAVADGAIIRVTSRLQSHSTDDLQNVFHLRHDTGSAQAEQDFMDDASVWLEAIFTCFITHVLNSIEFIDIGFYNVTGSAPWPSQDWPVLTWGGLDANDLPHGVAALVSMETATKNVGGRKYFGGFPVTDISDGGTWTSAFITLMACVLPKVVGLQNGTTVDFTPGVWSKDAALFRPFTGSSFDSVPAYQRRRRPGHGG